MPIIVVKTVKGAVLTSDEQKRELLKKMIEMGGSDLHITTNSAPRVRVHGRLRPLDMPPLTAADTSGPANLLVRPRILDQPRSQTAQVGDTVTFSISAEGVGTLSYRWRRNGRIIPGQTSSTLVMPSVQLSEAGTYSVTVTHTLPAGICGIQSSNAVLTVSQGP